MTAAALRREQPRPEPTEPAHDAVRTARTTPPSPAQKDLLDQLPATERPGFERLRRGWHARLCPLDEPERAAADAIVGFVWRGATLAALEERLLRGWLEGAPPPGLPSLATLCRYRARLAKDRELVERDLIELREHRPQPLPTPDLNPDRLEWLAAFLRGRAASHETEPAAAAGLDPSSPPPADAPRPGAAKSRALWPDRPAHPAPERRAAEARHAAPEPPLPQPAQATSEPAPPQPAHAAPEEKCSAGLPVERGAGHGEGDPHRPETGLEPGAPAAHDVEGGAVRRSGDREGQAAEHRDPLLEDQELDRDMPLVVVHRNDRVELAGPLAQEGLGQEPDEEFGADPGRIAHHEREAGGRHPAPSGPG